jgi:putative phosphoribosyl transferase
MLRRFRDRSEAGQLLAGLLARYAGRSNVLILALPRGGVPVAFAVAQALHAPLDILVVRKLGLPDQVELAMGAIASGGVRVLNDEVVDALHIPQDVIDGVAAREQAELERRDRVYRADRPAPVLRDQTVILVDDGLATGTTMRAAVAAVRAQRPARLVVAIPVAAAESLVALRPLVDALVCVIAPQPFYAIGLWYEDFAPTSDAEVCALLAQVAHTPRLRRHRQQQPRHVRRHALHRRMHRARSS